MTNGRCQMAKRIPHSKIENPKSKIRSFPMLRRLGKCGQAVEAATVVPELALGASSLGSSGPGMGNLAQYCFGILAVECGHSRSGEIFQVARGFGDAQAWHDPPGHQGPADGAGPLPRIDVGCGGRVRQSMTHLGGSYRQHGKGRFGTEAVGMAAGGVRLS